MSQKYHVLNNTDGGIRIPVADGEYSTAPGINENDYRYSQFVISFKDANGEAVTPTDGTITPLMSPIDGQLQEPGGNVKVVNATDVVADIDGVATYPLLVFTGLAQQGVIELKGIKGADHAIAYFWKS